MARYIKKVLGNVSQESEVALSADEKAQVRKNIGVGSGTFTSNDSSMLIKDNDDGTINLSTNAFTFDAEGALQLEPDYTTKTLKIQHVTIESADAAAVKVGRDNYGHVVLGDAITATDVGAADSEHSHGNLSSIGALSGSMAVGAGDAIAIVDASDNGKLVASAVLFGDSTTKYLRNDGQWIELGGLSDISLDNNAVPSGITTVTKDGKNYLTVNTGDGLSIDTDKKIPGTETDNPNYGKLVVSEANDTTAGGIKTGYTSTDKKYAIELDDDGRAFVDVPWVNSTYTIVTAATAANTTDEIAGKETNAVFLNMVSDSAVTASHKIYGGGLTKVYAKTAGEIYIETIISADDIKTASIATYDTPTTSGEYSLVLTDGKICQGTVKLLSVQSKSGIGETDAGAIYINYGDGFSVNDDNKLVYTVPTATGTSIGGIQVGYTTADNNYAVQLDSSSNAYVHVPVVTPNSADLTITTVETHLPGGAADTTSTTVFNSDASTDVSTPTLALGNHGHGYLGNHGELSHDASITSGVSSSYIADNPNNTVSLAVSVKGTDSQSHYIQRSGITFDKTGTGYLKQDGSWGNPVSSISMTTGTTHGTVALIVDSVQQSDTKVNGLGDLAYISDAKDGRDKLSVYSKTEIDSMTLDMRVIGENQDTLEFFISKQEQVENG